MGFPQPSEYESSSDFVKALFDELVEVGTDWKYDEDITQLEHALQCAFLARADGLSRAEVAAALLHDVGHFLMAHLAKDERHNHRDLKHEEVGAEWLAQYFVSEVSEPVRHHVPAKRYLCAVEKGYWGELSNGSKVSLEKQGGPMNATEIAAFETLPGHAAAVRLRRYDDCAKVVDKQIPHIREFAEDVLTSLKA
jgi:predicted HD phosphohydrolase